MESNCSIQEIYDLWRWAKYNEVNTLKLTLIAEKPDFEINSYIDKISDSIYYKAYTPELLYNYRNKNFNVSSQLIDIYDKKILELYEYYSKKGVFQCCGFLRSIYIENCLIFTNQLNREKLKERIKNNLIYYHWWDFLSFEKLCQKLVELDFVKSTVLLIGEANLIEYLKRKYINKDQIISQLLENFEPSNFAIDAMNDTFRGEVMFDYNWLFGNELKKSIRILENECRYDFKQKIIGAFYNEDLLFREIKRTFGEDHEVVSQGSPYWLSPQRFDIYFPKLNIAIEYQGEQHFEPIDFGGMGEEEAERQFQNNLKRDELKKEKAQKHNCALIYVLPDFDIEVVLNSINNEILKRGII